eukprot:COSAG06_NODE_30165_length_543_cov_1.261261_2_plen_20_part_01
MTNKSLSKIVDYGVLAEFAN